jgi:exodeoxyribonuclease VIII
MKLEEINDFTKKMKPGERLRLVGIDDSIYHASNGIGSTDLKRFIDSPAGFMYGPKFEQKDCFDLGSAVHTLVLEPDKFDDNYVEQPSEIKTRRGKEWDKFKEENAPKVILKADDMERARNMSSSVLTSHQNWFQSGDPEVSYWYKHENGIITKSRVDYQIESLAIDLKSTSDAHPESFEKKAIDFGYHIQNQLYIMTTGLDDFVFVVVNNKEPYQVVGPMMFEDEAKRYGKMLVMKALEDFFLCTKEQEWPNYTDYKDGEMVMMGLKPWHYKKMQNLEEKFDFMI